MLQNLEINVDIIRAMSLSIELEIKDWLSNGVSFYFEK